MIRRGSLAVKEVARGVHGGEDWGSWFYLAGFVLRGGEEGRKKGGRGYLQRSGRWFWIVGGARAPVRAERREEG